MYRQLYQFFENHNVISPTQFGLRKHRSTEMALLEQKEFILSEFEKKNMSSWDCTWTLAKL